MKTENKRGSAIITFKMASAEELLIATSSMENCPELGSASLLLHQNLLLVPIKKHSVLNILLKSGRKKNFKPLQNFMDNVLSHLQLVERHH